MSTSRAGLEKLAEAIKEAKERGLSISDTYSTFKTKYRNDPAGFVRDCIDWEQTPHSDGAAFYQIEILNEIPKQHRISVRGPHGLGKTALASWVILWFALTRDGEDWKIPTTASAWRQLTKYLWPEIHKWARKLRWDVIGREPFSERLELHTQNLRLATGEAFALASNQSDLIEGAHAANLLYVFDESKVIPDDTWDSAEGAFSVGDVYWLSISTPGEPQGRFYEIQSRKPGYEDWWVRYVTREECIKAGRMDLNWAESRKRQWGESSAVYQNRVEGKFASSDEDGVIALSHIEAANERWLEWKDAGGKLPEFTCVGADIARSGIDKTVLALRYDWLISELRRFTKADTMETTGQIAAILNGNGGKNAKAIVDVIGIGAGPVDRLREMGYQMIIAFNAGEKTDATDKSGELGFINKRSAAWWNMRELLSDPESQIALPPDDKLTGDLTAPHWKMTSAGKVQVEAKEDIKKRIGRSTDDGDAVIQAFWDNASPYGGIWA